MKKKQSSEKFTESNRVRYSGLRTNITKPNESLTQERTLSAVELVLMFPIALVVSYNEHLISRVIDLVDISALERLFIKAILDMSNYRDSISTRIKNKICSQGFITQHLVSINNDDLIDAIKKNRINELIKRVLPKTSIELMQIPEAIIDMYVMKYIADFYEVFYESENGESIVDIILGEKWSEKPILANLRLNLAARPEVMAFKRFAIRLMRDKNQEIDEKHKNYYEYIERLSNVIETSGFSPKVADETVLTVELDEIFVHIPLAEVRNMNTISENLRVIERGNVPDQFNDNIIPISKEDQIAQLYENILLSYHKCIILGDPGSGKSTILKYFAYCISSLSKRFIQFPIRIRVASYAEWYEVNKAGIKKYIIDNELDNKTDFVDLFEYNYKYHNILFLFDGLDEVTDTTLRLRVVEQINKFAAANSRNQFIITSRKTGYAEAPLHSDFTVFETTPLTMPLINKFISRWYKWYDKKTSKSNHKDAQTLIKAIEESEPVQKLATNPLLLTIIVMIHYRGKRLPNRRVELYEISADTFLENWVRFRLKRDGDGIDKNEIYNFLSPVAYYIHSNSTDGLIMESDFRDIYKETYEASTRSNEYYIDRMTCDSFIEFINRKTGLFIEKGLKKNEYCYGFLHQTFLEYFCAIEFARMYFEEDSFCINNFAYNSKWFEVICLAAAIIGNNKASGRKLASDFIDKLLKLDEIADESKDALLLANNILCDDVEVFQKSLNVFFDRFIMLMTYEGYDALTNTLISSFSKLVNSIYADQFLSRIIKAWREGDHELRKNMNTLLASASKTESSLNRWLNEVEESLNDDTIKFMFNNLGNRSDNKRIIEGVLRLAYEKQYDLPYEVMNIVCDIFNDHELNVLNSFISEKNRCQIKFVNFWRSLSEGTFETVLEQVEYHKSEYCTYDWYNDFVKLLIDKKTMNKNGVVVIITSGNKGLYLFMPDKKEYSLIIATYETLGLILINNEDYFSSIKERLPVSFKSFEDSLVPLKHYYCDQLKNLSEEQIDSSLQHFLADFTVFRFDKLDWRREWVKFSFSTEEKFFKAYFKLKDQLRYSDVDLVKEEVDKLKKNKLSKKSFKALVSVFIESKFPTFLNTKNSNDEWRKNVSMVREMYNELQSNGDRQESKRIVFDILYSASKRNIHN